MTSDEAIARECIRQTIAGYTVAADNRDPEMFNAQFADNAILEFPGFGPLPGFKNEGAAQIRERTAGWKKLPIDDPTLRSATFIRHNLTTCQITLTGKDTATAKTYFVVFTDIGPDHAGTYSDELVRHGDRWLLSHRRIALDWRSPDSIFPPVKK
jgi:hypothetical protein